MESTLPFNNHQKQALNSLTVSIFSVILLAMVDANYKFVYVDVGATGRVGDAGVFGDSVLKRALSTNSLDLPDEVELALLWPGRAQSARGKLKMLYL